ALVDPEGQALEVELVAAPGALVAGSARLHVDTGAGWVESPLAAQPNGAFLASFPPTSCGADVAWYMTARSTSGRTWSWPQGAPTLVAHATAAQTTNVVLLDRLETPTTWSGAEPTDTATGGRWTHGDPNGSNAQPEDDHTLAGVNC